MLEDASIECATIRQRYAYPGVIAWHNVIISNNAPVSLPDDACATSTSLCAYLYNGWLRLLKNAGKRFRKDIREWYSTMCFVCWCLCHAATFPSSLNLLALSYRHLELLEIASPNDFDCYRFANPLACEQEL
jgi:hypothetical protein